MAEDKGSPRGFIDPSDEPTVELDEPLIPDGTADYSTDELAVPTALVDEIEAIGAGVERDPSPRPQPVHFGRSAFTRVAEAFGWLVLLAGLVMSGTGIASAIDGHLQADRSVDEATTELESARAAVGSITGSRSVAAGRIDATAEKVAETEARISELSDELVELEGVVSDLVVIGNRRGMDFEAIMPSLESLGGVLDETVAGLIELGIGFEPTVSASEAFGVLSDRQAEARAAAQQALEEMTVDEGDGDGFGFDTILLQYPVPGKRVTGVFGICRDGCTRRHAGIDMSAPTWTPILSVADGTVSQAGWISSGAGYGVVVDHGNGWESKYFHMPTGRLPVRVGDFVTAGQHIGWVGNTGNSAGPHLHFEIEINGININPMRGFRYVGAADASIAAAMPEDGAPLGGPTTLSPSTGDLLLADLLEPLVGDEARDYSAPPTLDGPITEIEDELAAARSLIQDRAPQDEAAELIASASERVEESLARERELLVRAAYLLGAGLSLAVAGVWIIGRSRRFTAA